MDGTRRLPAGWGAAKAWRLAFLLLGGLGLASSHALEWKAKELSLDPAPGQPTVAAVFEYKNTSSKDVKILRARSSCGCLVADGAERVVKAGESGSLRAVFKIGNRVGRQSKTILVQSTDEANPTDVLKLVVNIPEVVEVESAQVRWKAGEPLEPQTLKVKKRAPEDHPLMVKTAGTAFAATIREEPGGAGEAVLTITPKVEKGPVAGTVRVLVQDASGQPRSKTVSCVVE